MWSGMKGQVVYYDGLLFGVYIIVHYNNNMQAYSYVYNVCKKILLRKAKIMHFGKKLCFTLL